MRTLGTIAVLMLALSSGPTLAAQTEEVAAKLQAISDQVAAIDKRIGAVEQRITTMEQTLGRADAAQNQALSNIERRITNIEQALNRAFAADSLQNQMLTAIHNEIKGVHVAVGLPRILGIRFPCPRVGNPPSPHPQCAADVCGRSGFRQGGTAISFEPIPANPNQVNVTGVACRP